jgi:ArsR family transcriptional regulator
VHYVPQALAQDFRPVTIQSPDTISPDTPIDMAQRATEAAAFLKTLAHEGRLMTLCHLGTGEKSVGELEALLGMRQAAVSQMLARLRDEELVATRREGKTIFYSLKDTNTEEIISLLYRQFCGGE